MEKEPSDQDKFLYFLDYGPAYRMKLVKELIGSVDGKTVADIGCGKGSISYLLWSMGAEVYSFDVSANELRITRSLKKTQETETEFDPTICQCDAGKLPIIKEAFDAIVCLETLEHLQNGDDKLAITEIERTAKPGAKIILSIPYAKRTNPNAQTPRYRHYSYETIKTRLIPKQLRLEQTVFWYFPMLTLFQKMGLRLINASIGSILLAADSKNPSHEGQSLKSKDGFTQSLMAYYNTWFWRKIALPAILTVMNLNNPFRKMPYSNDVLLILKKK